MLFSLARLVDLRAVRPGVTLALQRGILASAGLVLSSRPYQLQPELSLPDQALTSSP